LTGSLDNEKNKGKKQNKNDPNRYWKVLTFFRKKKLKSFLKAKS